MPAVSQQWLAEARAERDRLLYRADELLCHLSVYHYAPKNPVGMNLRAELARTQNEAVDLGILILEALTQQNAERRSA
jgi:hypothetical protein